MKDKLEQIFNKHHEGYAVYNKDEIIKELLVLFDVVGQSEQLCCNKCGSKEIKIWDNHSNCKKCLNVW